MGKLFQIDNPFIQAMTKAFDLVMLNMVFLLCCLPVVTVGASCTALHSVTMKLAAGEEPYVVRHFWKAFLDNFKQATMTWLLLLAAGALLYTDFQFAAHGGTGGIVMQCVFGFLAILYLFVLLYIFPLQSRYQNTIWKNAGNALLIGIRQLPKTVLLAAVVAVPVLLALYGPVSFFFIWLVSIPVIFCSGVVYVHDRILLGIFAYYE